MVTNLYWANRFGEDVLKYARIKDPQTEIVRLAEPHELENPEDIEIGDEYPYKVSLFQTENISEYKTY